MNRTVTPLKASMTVQPLAGARPPALPFKGDALPWWFPVIGQFSLPMPSSEFSDEVAPPPLPVYQPDVGLTVAPRVTLGAIAVAVGIDWDYMSGKGDIVSGYSISLPWRSPAPAERNW